MSTHILNGRERPPWRPNGNPRGPRGHWAADPLSRPLPPMHKPPQFGQTGRRPYTVEPESMSTALTCEGDNEVLAAGQRHSTARNQPEQPGSWGTDAAGQRITPRNQWGTYGKVYVHEAADVLAPTPKSWREPSKPFTLHMETAYRSGTGF